MTLELERNIFFKIIGDILTELYSASASFKLFSRLFGLEHSVVTPFRGDPQNLGHAGRESVP